jgi:hypothetical protein
MYKIQVSKVKLRLNSGKYNIVEVYKMLFMKKLELTSLIDFFVLISETIQNPKSKL